MVQLLPTHKKNLWVGIEAEGRLKGLKTLFISRNLNYETIFRIADKHKCSHLYFNAGKRQINAWDIVEKFIGSKFIITVEATSLISIPQKILKNCHIMLRIENNNVNFLKPTDTIKIETQYCVHCITKEQMIQTSINDYKNDEAIC